jgi:hypothetical protein
MDPDEIEAPDETGGGLRFPRDPAIDKAIARLEVFFDDFPQSLFYSTQIATLLEREFFHWITGKALLEMGNLRQIQRSSVRIGEQVVNFYAHRKYRYIRRELKTKVAVLNRIFDSEFTHAVGRHGELMFDAALGRIGFWAKMRDTTSWDGKSWVKTAHNLDRIITRDGVAYGVEIKNTQNYIPHNELLTKISLCKFLGVKPLFIMRFAPKSYVYEIGRNGGFALPFEHQLYPWGHGALLKDVKAHLQLKVGCPRDVEDGHMQRFLNWHELALRK